MAFQCQKPALDLLLRFSARFEFGRSRWFLGVAWYRPSVSKFHRALNLAVFTKGLNLSP
jgi:hypothetical protein